MACYRKLKKNKQMKKGTVYSTCVLLLFTVTALAQSTEELQKKYAGQMAVFTQYGKNIELKFSKGALVAELTEEKELLVLDEKANGMFNRQSVYYGQFDKLIKLEAYTKAVTPNGVKKIAVEDFKTQSSRSSGVFYDDVKEVNFDFPTVGKGSTCFMRAEHLVSDIHFMPSLYFFSYLPVQKFSYTVAAPAGVELGYVIKNNDKQQIKVNSYKKGKTTYWEFTAENILPNTYYSDAPSATYYLPHVLLYVASYKDGDGNEKKVFSSLKDLYTWNYNFLQGVNKEKPEMLKLLVDSLTKDITDKKEITKRIYQWVQDHIKYVAFEEGLEGFIPRQAADVYYKRYGDCKDMCSILTVMLKLAGVDAYYTWIGTRSIPYKYNEVFLPLTDNHMICTASINDKWYFIDGTDPNCIFGFPSEFIQGKEALVAINQDEYKILNVPEVHEDQNLVVDSTFISIADAGINGKSSVYYHGYFGIDFMNDLQMRQGKDEKDYIRYKMGKASNKFLLGDYSILKLSPAERLVNVKASFEVPGYGKKIGDEYFINMNLEKFFTTQIIDTAKRKVSVETGYKYTIRQFTILEIPETFSVSYQPKDFVYDDELLHVNISYQRSKNKIVVLQEIKQKILYLQPASFGKWNQALQKLMGYYKEQLVLKKQ
jgi:Domain of Unknown Function with PDB structure (DUF3857)/Transglutaminase-like superfamily